MIRRIHKCKFLTVYAVLLAMTTAGFLLMPVQPSAQTDHLGIDPDFTGIRISADQAVIDGKGRQTEFKGHVKVTVDETKIEADWLGIAYRQGIDPEKSASFTEESIEKIIAKGNVKIIFEDKTAVANQAVYLPHNKTLVLTGENSRITSGKDFIAGDKITFDRLNQTFTVESTGGKQVEVVFSQEKSNGDIIP